MDNRHLLRESFGYAPNGLWGQSDFWHQKNRLPSLCECGGNRAQVDFGFAAAGHAVQKEAGMFGAVLWRLERLVDFIPDRLLVGCQLGRAARHKVEVAQGIAPDLFAAQFNQAIFDQPMERRVAFDARQIQGLLDVQRPPVIFCNHFQQISLLAAADLLEARRQFFSRKVGVDAPRRFFLGAGRQKNRFPADQTGGFHLAEFTLDGLPAKDPPKLRQAGGALFPQMMDKPALQALIRGDVRAAEAVAAVGLAGEARRQHQPDANADGREISPTEPMRQVDMFRQHNRLGVEKLQNGLGFGDFGLIMSGDNHPRLHRHAKFHPHQRPRFQLVRELVRDVIGKGLVDGNIHRNLGIAHPSLPIRLYGSPDSPASR